MIESIQLIQKMLKRGKEIEGFPKKVNNIGIQLIDWYDWIISVIIVSWLSRFICMYVLSNMIELIDRYIMLYRFMVIESIHFHNLP